MPICNVKASPYHQVLSSKVGNTWHELFSQSDAQSISAPNSKPHPLARVPHKRGWSTSALNAPLLGCCYLKVSKKALNSNKLMNEHASPSVVLLCLFTRG